MAQVIVNVPMTRQLKTDLEQLVVKGRYTSLSELMREGARKVLDSSERLTINGFTPEFEEEILKNAQEPLDSRPALKTMKEVEHYFSELYEQAKAEKMS